MMDNSSEEGMQSILANMALSHEMIMNDDFQLKTINEDPSVENSFEKHVHDIVHKAFWDILEKDIQQQPPVYNNVLELLKEMKTNILELMKNKSNQLYQQVQEEFDLDLLSQQIQHDTFDLTKFAHFILNILSQLCAPVRDEKVEELRQVVDVVPLLRGVFELINLIKIDMVNYEVKTLKPILLQQAVEYEKQKFAELLKQKPDSLTVTTEWLQGAYRTVKDLKKPGSPIRITPALIITNAYLSLLESKEDTKYPETLYMDIIRLQDIGIAFKQLINLSSILTVSMNFLGVHFSTDENFVKNLKRKIMILIVDYVNLTSEILENVFVQVIEEGDIESEKKGLQKKPEEQKYIFKQQLLQICNPDNNLKDLIKGRIRDFVLLSMTSDNQVPSMASTLIPIQTVLKDTTQKFLRVIQHNKRVYMEYYVDIIQKFLTNENQKHT